ncbi:MAG: ATP-binding protein [Bacillus sp. (in: firmicutes)]
MLYFEQVLLLIFIIISPIIFFNIYCNDEEYFPSHWKRHYIFFVLMCCSSFLLLHFSSFQVWNHSISFYSLVVLYTILYGSRKQGCLLLLVVLIYNALLFDFHFPLLFLLAPLAFLIPLLCQSNWKRYSKRVKLRCSFFYSLSVFLGFCLIMLVDIWLKEENFEAYPEAAGLFLFIGISYVCVFYIMVFLTEFLIENRLLKQRAQESEKMLVVSELAASVAHEVRNPLTVIKGFVELVEQETQEKNKTYLKIVLSEINRAEAIITDYLQLAKKTNKTKGIFSVSEMAETVYSVMSTYTHTKGTELFLKKEEDLYIYGDISQVKQVCYNLIKNSVEAIPHSNGKIEMSCYAEKNNVIIVIKDNGTGMEQHELMRVGEPFYTNKENGTGLGIMVTKGIVQEHNGTICFESKKGAGTKVILKFPKQTGGKDL